MTDKATMLESLKAASLLMDGAAKIIDLKHGAGYAKEQPALVGAFMLVAALDLHAQKFSTTLAQTDATGCLVEIGAQIIDAIHLSSASNSGGVQ